MDIARCIEDNRTYNAIEFSRLHPAELERKRRLLACDECGGPAFFRKASRSGRAACFGARPHADGCELAAQDHEQHFDGQGDDLDAINNPAERIVVDLNFGAQEHQNNVAPNGNGGRPGRAAQYLGVGPRPDARMHRRLSSLLRTLIDSREFRTSQQLIEINGYPETRVCDFFVPLLEVSTRYNAQFRGWWGLISDAGLSQDGTVWINSGGRNTISSCLSVEMQAEVFQRFHIEELEDLSGAYILALGELRVSQNGKMYCVIESSGHLTIRRT